MRHLAQVGTGGKRKKVRRFRVAAMARESKM
jgi:hypothetical protein